MHVHGRTQSHTYICTRIHIMHTCTQECTFAYIHVTYAHIHTCTHIHKHTYMHTEYTSCTYAHRHTRTYTHTDTHTYTLIDIIHITYMHTDIHIHIHTCTCVYTDVHIHIHTYARTYTLCIHAHRNAQGLPTRGVVLHIRTSRVRALGFGSGRVALEKGFVRPNDIVGLVLIQVLFVAVFMSHAPGRFVVAVGARSLGYHPEDGDVTEFAKDTIADLRRHAWSTMKTTTSRDSDEGMMMSVEIRMDMKLEVPVKGESWCKCKQMSGCQGAWVNRGVHI